MGRRGKSRDAAQTNQGQLFAAVTCGSPQRVGAARGKGGFLAPDPGAIVLGASRLDVYLREAGELAPLIIAEEMKRVDWGVFESRYTGEGRPAYSPRLIAGLIFYGISKGVSSLRALESLARLDLGAMWISAGIQPDHSAIGRFILRHQSELEGEMFQEVTERTLAATQSSAEKVSGDGTVLQAAASRYRTLKKEALESKLDAARKEAQANPDDPSSRKRVDKYERASTALSQRQEERAAQRKPTESVRVSTTEPEASVQKLKTGSYAPAYQASALANDKRVIVAADIQPSSEIQSIAPMLDEAERVGQKPVQELSADGNYCCKDVIQETLKRDISLLTPVSDEAATYGGKFAKSRFRYDEKTNTYTCPAGETLTVRSRSPKQDYVTFSATACSGCPLRAQCVTSKHAYAKRMIKRYGVDDHKDALREVMRQPAAIARYRRRKTTIEPVFGCMRTQMKVTRLRRRGLDKARLEFKMIAIAYNLIRLVAAVLATTVALHLSAAHHAVRGALRALRALLPRFAAPPARVRCRPSSVALAVQPA